jgi:hypothetical protein
MNRARDRREGTPAYEEWKASRQLEIEEEQRQREAAQAEADAQNPELQFKRSMDAEAQAIRELILTGYVPDSILPGVTRIGGRKVLEEPAIRNWKYFAESTASFHYYMARPLLNAAERSDLAPVAPNYLALHNLMLQYSAYPEPPAQPVVTETQMVQEPQQVLTPSEIAEAKYKARMTDIVVYDPIDNKGYTEFDLENKVDSKTELRLRRLIEGKIGNEHYAEYMNRKDWQATETRRIAALDEER